MSEIPKIKPRLIQVPFTGGPLDGKTKLLTDAGNTKTTYTHPYKGDVGAEYVVENGAAVFHRFANIKTGETAHVVE